MPKVKKYLRSKEVYVCDFCKSKIEKDELHVRTNVRDQYGRYAIRHHEHCDRTAELNAIADRDVW